MSWIALYFLAGWVLAEICYRRDKEGDGPLVTKTSYLKIICLWFPMTIFIIYQKVQG